MCLAIPGRVEEILPPSDGLEYARINFDGVSRVVCTACLSNLKVDDYVLVHAGIALTRIDTEEANRLIMALRILGHEDTAVEYQAAGPSVPGAL
jgi:hydrogenase expression/formation protein HypC